MPEFSDYDDIRSLMDAEQEALDDIDEDVIRFPQADGYAMYRVVELEDDDGEPVLQHIPIGDAYRIPAAHIRGLRTEDVEQKIKQLNALKQLQNQ